MDFSWSPEQLAYKEKVVAFARDSLGDELLARSSVIQMETTLTLQAPIQPAIVAIVTIHLLPVLKCHPKQGSIIPLPNLATIPQPNL